MVRGGDIWESWKLQGVRSPGKAADGTERGRDQRGKRPPGVRKEQGRCVAGSCCRKPGWLPPGEVQALGRSAGPGGS